MRLLIVVLLVIISLTNCPAQFVYPPSGGSSGGGTVTSVATGCGTSGGTITTTGTIIASETVRMQTTTSDTFLDGDCGKLVTHSNGSAIAASLPQANGSTFKAGWFVKVQNRGVGTVTITPVTSTIDGAATLTLLTSDGVEIHSDGTNYFTQRGRLRGIASINSDTTAAQVIAGTPGQIFITDSGGTHTLSFPAGGTTLPGTTTGTFSGNLTGSATQLGGDASALIARLASPTFTGTVVLPSGQALIAPALGTPASGVMTNVTGVPAAALTGQVAIANGGTGATTLAGAGIAISARSIATTSPITGGGDLSADRTFACATCVTSSSPGVGIAHFAGSTQAVTSSAVNLASADVTGVTPAANGGTGIANSKTLTVSNNLTLAGTDATTMTFPTTSATIARTDAAQSFTGVQTFVAPILGTPTSGTLTNATGLPAAGVVGTAAVLGANAFTGVQTLGGATITNSLIPNTLGNVAALVSSTYTAARAVPMLGWYTTDNNATLLKTEIASYGDATNGGSLLLCASGTYSSGINGTCAAFSSGKLWLSNSGGNQIIGSSGFPGAAVPANHTTLDLYDNSNGAFVVDQTFSSAYYSLKRGGTEQWRLDSTGISETGLVVKANNIATAGMGKAPIYASAAQTAQTATIGATNLQCGAAVCAAGLYRVSVYTDVTTTGTGTLTSTIGWSDPAAARTITSVGVATTATNYERVDYTIRADGIANITYATTLSVSGTYAIYVTLERLQ